MINIDKKDSTIKKLVLYLEGDLTSFKKVIDQYQRKKGYIIYNPYDDRLTISQSVNHMFELGKYNIEILKEIKVNELKDYIYENSNDKIIRYSNYLLNDDQYNLMVYDQSDDYLFDRLDINNLPNTILNNIINRYLNSDFIIASMHKFIIDYRSKLIPELNKDLIRKINLKNVCITDIVKVFKYINDEKVKRNAITVINNKLLDLSERNTITDKVYDSIMIYLDQNIVKSYFLDLILYKNNSVYLINDIKDLNDLPISKKVVIIEESLYNKVDIFLENQFKIYTELNSDYVLRLESISNLYRSIKEKGLVFSISKEDINDIDSTSRYINYESLENIKLN